jgi:hypothetical protein
MTEKTEKPDDKKGGAGEPPPLIKQIIWLLNHQNWQRHWRAILLASIVIAATPFIPKFIDHKLEQPLSEPDKHKGALLPEEQIRRAILKALHDGDVGNATNLLSGLGEGLVKSQECEHVFEFCIKNGKLSEAKRVVDACWEGKQKNVKLAQIEHEQLKQ